MKRITLILLLISAVNLNLFSQVDPCYVVKEVLTEVDNCVVQGKYDDALQMLEKVKKDPKYKQCPEMKDGVVDYKIKDIKEKIGNNKTELLRKCPDNNHPHAIDLGLPSGTKWACCNVGASKPDDYGEYYAWGETNSKSAYTWKTYRHCNGKQKNCYDLGPSICGTQYDVAHVKWGGRWNMPTSEQMKELISKCKHQWMSVNHINGYLFTGPNGRSIFMPAAGSKSESDKGDSRLFSLGDRGDYWTGMPVREKNRNHEAYYLKFYRNLVSGLHTDCWRSGGMSVRPVAK